MLSGRASPALLDSYEAERRPHAQQIMEMSLFLGQVTNEDDPQKAAARDEAFRTRTMPPMPPFPKVEHGVVHREADGSLLACTGVPGPQAVVRRGETEGRLDDVVGHGFLLVAQEDPAPFLNAAQRDFLAQLGCRIVVLAQDERVPGAVVELDGEVSGFMAAHGIRAYIGRPDFVIFGAVPRMGELAALVDDLRLQLQWIDGERSGQVAPTRTTEPAA